MDLKSLLRAMPADERGKFAERCGVSLGHLRNVAGGKACAPELAINIERESGGKVRCEDLTAAADWNYIRGTSPGADAPQEAA